MPIRALSLLLFGAAALHPCLCQSTFDQYLHDRNEFIEDASKLSINAAWKLRPDEAKVDEILASYKEIDYSLDPVPVQFNFITTQSTIDSSQLFKLIKSFPKGALLHSHDVSSISMYYYVNASYLPGCLYNVGDSYGDVSFLPAEGFVPIDEVRNSYEGGAAAFDEALYRNFTLSSFEGQSDTTGDYLWEQFEPIFSRVNMMYYYLPVFKNFFRAMFTKLFEDGVIRWEMRTSVDGVYDGDRTYSPAEAIGIVLEELEDWKAEDYENRKIFSYGIIWQGMRSGTVQQVTDSLLLAYDLRETFPDVILGFDLVGHEDPGKTLLYWAPVLLNVQETVLRTTNITRKMPFFFHAGESNRIDVQENLVDSVFLNTTRIGHGFGIQEFPALWPSLTSAGILIESCPISNQVLGLIVDQRNHPVGQILHHALHNPASRRDKQSPRLAEILEHKPQLRSIFQNMIVTPALATSISNDDPGFWDIDAVVSYDWYIAILAWDLSLAGIKQLAIDSIVHSGGSVALRAEMLVDWSKSWDAWIMDVASGY